ncbi:hypothetical protein QJS66_02745 [Kocuria rhizophila]|nr:hypothetical protein QJS66_02745 [Kocuria rhizophila]
MSATLGTSPASSSSRRDHRPGHVPGLLGEQPFPLHFYYSEQPSRRAGGCSPHTRLPCTWCAPAGGRGAGAEPACPWTCWQGGEAGGSRSSSDFRIGGLRQKP